ncbi:MAG TPA: hypothetical protein VK609_07340 [Mucilaginibacter sp.]|nr:hypothetical protein [Mucilaginibacter sp.]
MQSKGDYFRKYRNVIYTDAKLQSLFRFLDKIPGGWDHVNFYDKESRNFVEQVKNK